MTVARAIQLLQAMPDHSLELMVWRDVPRGHGESPVELIEQIPGPKGQRVVCLFSPGKR